MSKWLEVIEKDEIMTNGDRLIYVLYKFGICTREQLVTLTGWTEHQVTEAIRTIRNKVPYPARLKSDKKKLTILKTDGAADQIQIEELEASIKDRVSKIDEQRDKWLQIMRPQRNKEAFYTLGEKGILHACEIRMEPFKKWKKTPVIQASHFVGTNEILCRLRREGVVEYDWLSAKEVEVDLYYYWNRYQQKKMRDLPESKRKGFKFEKLPCKPDALLVIEYEDGSKEYYFIEFDTGKETKTRLRSRFRNYLKVYEGLSGIEAQLYPVIWVVKKEKRIKELEAISKQVLEDYKKDNSKSVVPVPLSYAFKEGDETKFILGELESHPFWG